MTSIIHATGSTLIDANTRLGGSFAVNDVLTDVNVGVIGDVDGAVVTVTLSAIKNTFHLSG